MRLAHSALSGSISFARIHALNRLSFTYYATCILRLLHAVLRVPGKPTVIINLAKKFFLH